MDDYLASCEAGQPLTADELAARFPELSEQVNDCLASLDFIRRAAAGSPLPLGEGGSRSEPGEGNRLPTPDTRLPSADAGTLGDFRILREIGRGGMGIVYEAEQISLERRVALKVLPFASVLDAKQLARFKNEALAAASLDHPHIVDVLGVGCDRGMHFYAMRLIDGCTLADVITELRNAECGMRKDTTTTPHSALRIPHLTSTRAVLTTLGLTDAPQRSRDHYRRIAALVADAADALHHAHEQGVIHRDIKPSNLMLDSRGKLWVTDFGLAHVESNTTLTMTGDLMGTLRYMSPEQASGSRLGIDHRTDIYSLGVTLYELLTLQPAFTSENRAELIRKIVQGEPRPPRGFDATLPIELQSIVLKAMEQDASDRYASAEGLADDLRRFGRDEPVRARPVGPIQHARRWTRRHWPLAVAASAIIALLGVTAGASYAVIASVEAGRRRDAELAADQLSYVADIVAARQELENFDFPRASQILDRYRTDRGRPDIRGFEWHLLWRMCNSVVHELPRHDGPAFLCSFSPDGRLLAFGCADHTVRIWDVETMQLEQVLCGHAGEVNAAMFSPDGSNLATGSDDGTLKLWSTSTWMPEATLDARQRPYLDVGFSPDGKWLAASGHDDEITLWEVSSRKPLGSVRGHTFAFSPDSERLATGHDHQLWQYELPSLLERATMEDAPSSVDSLLYMADGKTLLVGTGDGLVRFWAMPGGVARPDTIRVSQRGVEWMDRSTDGRLIATTSNDRGVRIWNAANMSLREQLAGFIGGNWCVAFSRTGRLLAATDNEGHVRLYGSRSSGHGKPLFARPGALRALSISPAGHIAVGREGQVFVLSPAGELLSESHAHRAPPLGDSWGADVSPDGSLLATAGYDRTVRLWSMPDLNQLDVRYTDGRLSCVRFDAGGQLMAWCGESNVSVLNLRTKQLTDVPVAAGNSGCRLAFVPGRSQLLIGDQRGQLSLFNYDSGIRQPLPTEFGDQVSSVTFSPDDKTLAVTSLDGTATLIDVATWKERFQLTAQASPIWASAFSPDGRTLATGGTDGQARLWHVATGRELVSLDHGDFIVYSLGFAVDGESLYTAGQTSDNEGELRVWTFKVPKSEPGSAMK
jgi:WD40 repeat protein/serine/threonine protein kinase